MKLRVGLIGLGEKWESRHLPALTALSERYQIRAVCCQVARRAQLVAQRFGADCVDGFRATINRHDVDAVLALSPDWVGPLPILAACEARKAVYSSAALDIEPGQASKIKSRVEESGVAFMAELPRRHSPATLRLKELIATTLGQPKLLFCHDRQDCEEKTGRQYRGEHCPTVMRNFMELVDWCRYIVGREPESLIGVNHKHTVNDDYDAEYQMVSMNFPAVEQNDRQLCDVTAQISIGHYVPPTWTGTLDFYRPCSLQICCENGVAFIDLPSTLVWFDKNGKHEECLELDRPVGEQMLTHFYRAVTSLIRRTNDLEDAYRALRIVLTAAESVKTGQRAKIVY